MMRSWAAALILTLLPATALAQDAQPPAAPGATMVRRFAVEGLDPTIARAELVALGRTAGPSDLVDLVTEFIPAYGQASNVIPANLAGGGMMSVLYQFSGERSILVMVHAAEPPGLAGPHACRIFMDASRGRPEPGRFARLVHWCANAVTLANLDPGALTGPAQ